MFEKIDIKRLSRNFQEQPWRKRLDKPVESDFRYLYEELNLSGEEICTFMGISQPTLSRAIRQFKLHKSREQINESRKNCFIEKFGSPSPLGNKEVRAKRNETCIEKFGHVSPMKNKNIAEKVKKTNIEKYGGNSPMCSDEVRKKSEQTTLKKYGVKNIFQSEEIKEKIKAVKSTRDYRCNLPSYNLIKDKVTKTIQEKYGVKNVFQSEEVKEKIRKTNLEKYGAEHYMQAHILHKENFNKEFWEANFVNKKKKFCVGKCALYHGINMNTVNTYKEKFGIEYPSKYESIGEIDIARICKELGFKTKKDRIILDGKEIDIYLPEAKLGIEYNGVIFHSTGNTGIHVFNRNLSKYDHFEKTFSCMDKGIRLLQVFDFEWLNKDTKNVWRGIIKEHLGKTKPLSYTKLKEVPDDVANEFLKVHSLYIDSKEGICNIMLYSKSNAIACVRLIDNFDTLTITDVGVLSGYSRVDAINIAVDYFKEKYQENISVILDNRTYNASQFPKYIGEDILEPFHTIFNKNDITNHRYNKNIVWRSGTALKRSSTCIIHDCGRTVIRSTDGDIDRMLGS